MCYRGRARRTAVRQLPSPPERRPNPGERQPPADSPWERQKTILLGSKQLRRLLWDPGTWQSPKVLSSHPHRLLLLQEHPWGMGEILGNKGFLINKR